MQADTVGALLIALSLREVENRIYTLGCDAGRFRSGQDSGEGMAAMSGPDDKDKRPKNENTPTAGDSGTDKRSGRVAFDSRGNPIWEWQLETGVYSRDVSTQKLKKLD